MKLTTILAVIVLAVIASATGLLMSGSEVPAELWPIATAAIGALVGVHVETPE